MHVRALETLELLGILDTEPNPKVLCRLLNMHRTSIFLGDPAQGLTADMTDIRISLFGMTVLPDFTILHWGQLKLC